MVITDAGTDNNRIVENEILDNLGSGVMLARPAGTATIGGNFIAQNRVHGKYPGGIWPMGPVSGNMVVQNDARYNNLSGRARTDSERERQNDRGRETARSGDAPHCAAQFRPGTIEEPPKQRYRHGPPSLCGLLLLGSTVRRGLAAV